MSKEIERKFLLTGTGYRTEAVERHSIEQGYLSSRPEATVRVRILDDKAFITVKSKNRGCLRDEWEYPVPVEDAREMMKLCDGDTLPIVKTRYIVPAGGGLNWEIDEFGGALAGLSLAEIELPSPDTHFTFPTFIGREVTGDPAYYNSNLARKS